jgi:diguanylate cyclase (GGDEF)-like protein
MESDTEQRVRKRLDLLRREYLRRLPEKMGEIDEVWDRVCQNAADSAALHHLHRLVHRLAGSSATHNLDEVSTTARHLDIAMQEMHAVLTDEQQASIATCLADLRRTIAQGPAALVNPAQSRVSTSEGQVVAAASQTEAGCWILERRSRSTELCHVGEGMTAGETEPAAEAEPSGRGGYLMNELLVADHIPLVNQESRCIFLVEDDAVQARDLALQIGHFGYAVHVFHDLAALKQAICHTRPSTIIMDVMFPEGHLAGVEVITEIRQLHETPIPVMFISSRGDIQARLQAVRAGGSAYFTKPVNVSTLIDQLDTLTTPEQPEPYRVLIIDDDTDIAIFYEQVLKQAGMHADFITNPLQVMQPLFEFRPDLILMDVYMPECTGLELASVIRQQEAYVGVPIVFLSMETDRDKQLKAMHRGGDDFLSKDILPNHLISAVESRARRSRSLRSTMIRDGLTGLLNHTTIKEHLYREVLYARRRNVPIAFAMIDIDRFKSINDTYGHITGDRVLKSLSRVLQQRLRKTDVIGRYGGEEFAVMLPDTDGQTATRVMDEIRSGFAQVRQCSGPAEFHVTFSCGVADFPTYEDAIRINKAADDALYEAKRAGRNQVVLATGM